MSMSFVPCRNRKQVQYKDISGYYLSILPDSMTRTDPDHQNLLGRISTTDLLLESDLHTRVLQTRLTPNLGKLFNIIKEEHDFAMRVELPQIDGQTDLHLFAKASS